MPGMLSDRGAPRLEAASGAAFDRLFLAFMIRHHQGALTMVEQLYEADGGLESSADAFARHVAVGPADRDRPDAGHARRALAALSQLGFAPIAQTATT